MKKLFCAMMHGIWVFLFYIVNICSLYSIWSKVYRFFNHSIFRPLPLDVGLSPEHAEKKLNLLKWTKDGKKELFDAIGSPHWVQHCINQVRHGYEQPKGALDCDEFSAWAAEVLDNRLCPLILSVSYRKKGKFMSGGHNVCVYLDKNESALYHISNWGIQGPFDDLSELMQSICDDMDATLIGYSIHSRGLKLLRFGVKYPRDLRSYGLMMLYYSTY